MTRAAALVMVGGAPGALAAGLAGERAAALHALLVRRAVAWAVAAAPGAVFVAVTPGTVTSGTVAPGTVAPGTVAPGTAAPGAAASGVDAIGALLPAGATPFAAETLPAAIARVGRGPLLIAGIGCPRLGAAHAATALADLRAGCDVVLGATLDGGWYLAGLREPRPELLDVAAFVGGIGTVLQRARELGAEVGLLRQERVLAAPGDAAALLADPLLDGELRAALSA